MVTQVQTVLRVHKDFRVLKEILVILAQRVHKDRRVQTVLTEQLGMSASQVEELTASGAVGAKRTSTRRTRSSRFRRAACLQ